MADVRQYEIYNSCVGHDGGLVVGCDGSINDYKRQCAACIRLGCIIAAFSVVQTGRYLSPWDTQLLLSLYNRLAGVCLSVRDSC